MSGIQGKLCMLGHSMTELLTNTASTLRELNITININHIDDNFYNKFDDCG